MVNGQGSLYTDHCQYPVDILKAWYRCACLQQEYNELWSWFSMVGDKCRDTLCFADLGNMLRAMDRWDRCEWFLLGCVPAPCLVLALGRGRSIDLCADPGRMFRVRWDRCEGLLLGCVLLERLVSPSPLSLAFESGLSMDRFSDPAKMLRATVRWDRRVGSSLGAVLLERLESASCFLFPLIRDRSTAGFADPGKMLRVRWDRCEGSLLVCVLLERLESPSPFSLAFESGLSIDRLADPAKMLRTTVR